MLPKEMLLPQGIARPVLVQLLHRKETLFGDLSR